METFQALCGRHAHGSATAQWPAGVPASQHEGSASIPGQPIRIFGRQIN
jgi:hypothetical protein